MITLAQVVSRVESGDNPFAMRFENELYFKIEMVSDVLTGDPAKDRFAKAIRPIVDNIQRIHTCSRPTAQMIAATSWGRYQILGENLYSVCGLGRPILSYVAAIDDIQDVMFEQFCLSRIGVSPIITEYAAMTGGQRSIFAMRYNGPATPITYMKRMDAVYAELAK